MSIIDRAKSHFESLGVQSIEIEEWKDDEGKPTIVYWNPITLAEKKKLFSRSDSLNDVGLLADIVIMKALDKDGNKLFATTDKLDIMNKVDSDVLAKISAAMVQAPTAYESKKKLNTTPELRNMLILADRLKITLKQVLDMTEVEYNLWIGFLMLEKDEYDRKKPMR